MDFRNLEILTNEELIEAVVAAAKKKNKKLSNTKENIHVNFRWGEQDMDKIYATVDVVTDENEVTTTNV